MAKRQKHQTFEFHGFAKRTHVRCEDCDLRGDLSTTGKPLVWIRICRCSACSGRGELPLVGLEQLDPYARKATKPAKYMVYKPWDVECRSRANAASRAGFNYVRYVMEAPPGGPNHGRKLGQDGEWVPLEVEGISPPSAKLYQGPRKHGTNYVYNTIGCRCDECKKWKRKSNADRYRKWKIANLPKLSRITLRCNRCDWFWHGMTDGMRGQFSLHVCGEIPPYVEGNVSP